MDSSILTSIKLDLGIAEDYEHFDSVIIGHINTEFMVLNQIGVGPNKTFSIADKSALWSDFTKDVNEYAGAKQYIFMRVKQIFDPYTSTVAADAHARKSAELEFRLNIALDIPDVDDNEVDTGNCDHEAIIDDDTLVLS